MPRAVDGSRRRSRRKRILGLAKGFWGGRRKLFRVAKGAVMKAGAYAYRDRRARKGEFRALWITRISAACRAQGMNYATFIRGLLLAEVRSTARPSPTWRSRTPRPSRRWSRRPSRPWRRRRHDQPGADPPPGGQDRQGGGADPQPQGREQGPAPGGQRGAGADEGAGEAGRGLQDPTSRRSSSASSGPWRTWTVWRRRSRKRRAAAARTARGAARPSRQGQGRTGQGGGAQGGGGGPRGGGFGSASRLRRRRGRRERAGHFLGTGGVRGRAQHRSQHPGVLVHRSFQVRAPLHGRGGRVPEGEDPGGAGHVQHPGSAEDRAVGGR